MENREIAKIFSQIADVLELKDENVFRIRAYRTASQNILSMAVQLADMYKEDPSALSNIQGIGKDLKEKIIEILEAGGLKYHKELLKEFPPEFLDLLNVSGLGPKKLKKLKDDLGIETLADLEKACEERKLEHLEGMGAKTQSRILDAIQYFKMQAGRMLLPEATTQAREVMEYLKKSGNFKKIEPAGSLRRGRETVGDLDILTVADNSRKAMDHFVSYSRVQDILAKGPTKSSILMKSGSQVDLRVIDRSCFGAAFLYFTGSKAHNIKLRTVAKNKGYKVSEHGIFKVDPLSKKEKLTAGKTEKAVYRVLGMEWIPPELREDRGEIEAAMADKLPKSLIELKHIKGDLHVHTTATDGHNTIEEMARAAKSMGYAYLGITDHSKAVRIANGMDEKRLLKHMEMIRKVDGRIKGIKLLAGIEVDILRDGKLDLKDAVLKELDIVIAAIHSHFALDRETQTARVLKGMENKHVNVLAHPSGRLIARRSPIELDFDRVFTLARNANIYLEVNTHGKRIDLNDVHCRRARGIGAKLAINTDSHDTDSLDQMIYGVTAARRGWVEKNDVLNTRPLGPLLKALKR